MATRAYLLSTPKKKMVIERRQRTVCFFILAYCGVGTYMQTENNRVSAAEARAARGVFVTDD
jgi:hypothetical protein